MAAKKGTGSGERYYQISTRLRYHLHLTSAISGHEYLVSTAGEAEGFTTLSEILSQSRECCLRVHKNDILHWVFSKEKPMEYIARVRIIES